MKKLFLFLKGMLMWACDVIPGVSWGTIAFITGIYEELIDALHAFNITSCKFFLTGQRKKFRKVIHGNFLLLVFWGIIVSIVTLVKVIHYLLQTYPSMVRAFFFWLVLASAFILKKSLKKRTNLHIIFLAIGLFIGYILTALPIVNLGVWYVVTFFSWVIGIMAMILPGISGSYILLIFGQYQHILWIIVDIVDGIKNFISNIGGDAARAGFWALPRGKLFLFILGAIVWLLAFSKLLHYIKKRRHDQLIIWLVWLMLGSLNKIWPRKETIEYFTDRHGELQPLVQKNIIPESFENLIAGLVLMGVGFGVVILIVKISERSKLNEK